ncbi:MAG: hypothetical protein COA42_22050 [Alteromonadaceae bacterium]|nr:MAG: hypothetical protein COA42_22050 [Alteromonadaceae bacterium]
MIKLDTLHYKTRYDFSLKVKDLHIPAGDSTAIIGRNGCGKTTLLECMLGLREAEECKGEVNGVPIAKLKENKAVLGKLGFQIQGVEFPFSSKVKDICFLHRSLYSHSDQSIYDAFDIDKLIDRKYFHCSVGERRRVDLFFALAHHPQLVALDEPGAGLDSLYRQRLQEQLSRRQIDHESEQLPPFTCLMTTHSYQELEQCEKLILIDQGTIQFFGDKQQFMQDTLGEFRLDLRFSGDLPEEIAAMTPTFCYPDRASKGKGQTLHHHVYFGDEQLKALASKLLYHPDIQQTSVANVTEKDVFDWMANPTQ